MKPFFSCIDVMKMYMDQSINILTIPEKENKVCQGETQEARVDGSLPIGLRCDSLAVDVDRPMQLSLASHIRMDGPQSFMEWPCRHT